MNFHTDEWIMDRMREHYNDALAQYPEHRIVGVFYQGSGNYGLDYEDSDVDTKCIIVPTIRQLSNEEKTSNTYVRSNEEHIDFKDIRVILETFRKSNLNFLEILYTKYYIINPMYEAEWNKLIRARDSIVNMNLLSLIKSMKGIAGEKFHALEHRYPSRMHVIEKWGYDCKQLHHLLRINQFMNRWTHGIAFEDCLIAHEPEWLVEVKKGKYDIETARIYAKFAMDSIERMYEEYVETCNRAIDDWICKIFECVSYNMIKIGIRKELETNV